MGNLLQDYESDGIGNEVDSDDELDLRNNKKNFYGT